MLLFHVSYSNWAMVSNCFLFYLNLLFVFVSSGSHQSTVTMADAENQFMETSEQNGEGEEDQNGAQQELMGGDDSQDADGGKIESSKREEDAG